MKLRVLALFMICCLVFESILILTYAWNEHCGLSACSVLMKLNS
jgi:hypothetical protein